MSYAEFLGGKSQYGSLHGFAPVWVPDFLFDFQRALVDWSVRKGRSAIFADCGMGKTPMQLVWAENVIRKTGRPVLIITPLAVSAQTLREAGKFGIECERSSDGHAGPNITITNYERLHHFDPLHFSGVVCDESSAIKSFHGEHRKQVTEFMRRCEYRLLCTATAAPNDYIELGTSSEALGDLGHMDMLGRFFVNDQNTCDTKRPRAYGGRSVGWRFKGHAEDAFWKWVCSWARAVRKPSDLGFDDSAFNLPDLIENDHEVTARTYPPGMLFNLAAVNFREEREERRRTIVERCEVAAELANHGSPVVVWCHMNDEGNMLSRMVRDSVQVRGADSIEDKERAYEDFALGRVRAMITKPKIGAWGLNWQHCAHVVTFASHSYEQYYQSVRRCWRYGQTRPVVVDLVATEGESRIRENMRRKARSADEMFSALIANMNDAVSVSRSETYRETVEVPSWLS